MAEVTSPSETEDKDAIIRELRAQVDELEAELEELRPFARCFFRKALVMEGFD
jgi:hypothetical protein